MVYNGLMAVVGVLVAILGWVLVAGSIMLTLHGGFDSWKMMFTITSTGLGMLCCLFSLLLGVTFGVKDVERRQTFVVMAVFASVPIVIFFGRFLFFHGNFLDYVLVWLQDW